MSRVYTGQGRRNGRAVESEGGRQAGRRAEATARLRDQDGAGRTILPRDRSAEGLSRQHHRRDVAGDQGLRRATYLNF